MREVSLIVGFYNFFVGQSMFSNFRIFVSFLIGNLYLLNCAPPPPRHRRGGRGGSKEIGREKKKEKRRQVESIYKSCNIRKLEEEN